MSKTVKLEPQGSMAVWDLGVNPPPAPAREGSPVDVSSDIYYRPFIYAAQPRFWQWGRKADFGKSFLKGKWFKLFFG